MIYLCGYYLLAAVIWLVWGIDIFPPCLWKWITGYECPGCGMTTAMLDILRMDLKAAFQSNALIFVVAPTILIRTVLTLYRSNSDVGPAIM
jgi:hypothetical protein